MIFLAPALLAGLLALSLPVAIHFFSRPRGRPVRWAAMRFLQANQEKNRRRSQLEDLFLLLLRVLVIALLVCVFARPALLTDHVPNNENAADGITEILLDNSASMAVADGSQSRFGTAKNVVEKLLDAAPADHIFRLDLVSDRLTPLVSKATSDRAILRAALQRAVRGDGATNLAAGIASAFHSLATHPAPRREIVVVTDSQLPAWRGLEVIRQLQAENPGIGLRVFPVGQARMDNLAISNLRLPGAFAAVDQPLRCDVQVTNWGSTAVTNLAVQLSPDGSESRDETVIARLDPGASRTVPLVARFTSTGPHFISARLSKDALPTDDERTLAFPVVERISALVVENAPLGKASASDGFFLRHALMPVSEELAEHYAVQVATTTPENFSRLSLENQQIVFLNNVAEVSAEAVRDLHRFLENGGLLVVFPGPKTQVHLYNAATGLGSLLPARLGALQHFDQAGKYLGWQSREYLHPVAQLWNDPAAGNLGGVRVSSYFPLLPVSTDPGDIVIRYTDGEPALVEHNVGAGRVFLFGSSATTAWSTLPLHPGFVPLLIQIMAHGMRQPGGDGNVLVGKTLTGRVDAALIGRPFQVQRPGDATPGPSGRVEGAKQGGIVRFRDTSRAGAHRIFIDGKLVLVFAAQLDASESNLQTVAESEIDFLLHPKPVAVEIRSPAAASPGQPAGKIPGAELWFWVALALLCLAFAELALANHRRLR